MIASSENLSFDLERSFDRSSIDFWIALALPLGVPSSGLGGMALVDCLGDCLGDSLGDVLLLMTLDC